jgi:hypothetical protein
MLEKEQVITDNIYQDQFPKLDYLLESVEEYKTKVLAAKQRAEKCSCKRCWFDYTEMFRKYASKKLSYQSEHQIAHGSGPEISKHDLWFQAEYRRLFSQ